MPETARVCVVGSLNMDLVVRAPRLPVPGETVLGGAYRTFPGGKGANQAVAARRMGCHVTLVGCIGDDPHGIKVRQTLEAEGIDLTHLRTRAGEATGLALITVAEGGENTIVVSPGCNAAFSADDVAAARGAIEACDVVLMQLEVPNPAVIAGANLARELGKVIILNAAPARALPPEVMKTIDVLVVNRSEAARLLGLDSTIDPARLALRLPELGVPVVVLTQGSQGAILNHRGRPRRVPAHPVTPTDATGAGDAFCGALAAVWPFKAVARSHEEFRDAEEALKVASAAGALATTKLGAIASMPKADEVFAAAATMKSST